LRNEGTSRNRRLAEHQTIGTREDISSDILQLKLSIFRTKKE
jgi:hypothetical protein